MAFLITHAHMAGVKDMISGLFNTYTYSILMESKYMNYSIYQELLTMDRLVRELPARNPEGLYDIMKAWSSLTIACILRDMEDNTYFIDTDGRTILVQNHRSLQIFNQEGRVGRACHVSSGDVRVLQNVWASHSVRERKCC